MRRRFLSYDLFQTIIPVFAVSISAPLSTWKNAVHILTTRSRESGGINEILNIPNAYPSQNISLDIAMMLLSLRLDH